MRPPVGTRELVAKAMAFGYFPRSRPVRRGVGLMGHREDQAQQSGAEISRNDQAQDHS
jgi:hypothetical protein